MIIALDAAIPYWKEAFSNLGNLRPLSAVELKAENIRDADALVIRSVTSVNAELLEGSSVRFVGAASAGTDHIDQKYLKSRGIHFSCAAGCNADSVAEYIVTALHTVAVRRGWQLKSRSMAVVGVGNVGSRVAKKALALGMEVLLCDPPIRDLTGDPRYLMLEDVLGADVLSFHVPLAKEGLYPTWHLINDDRLRSLSAKQFLINSARGAVIDNQALKSALQEGRIEGAVLDVWEGEPKIDYSLLDLIDIGTPHIAGSSMDGKIRATEMMRDALCGFLGIKTSGGLDWAYPAARQIHPPEQGDCQFRVLSVLKQAFDILKDDADLKSLRNLPANEAALRFERLRTQYAFRPEFRHFTVGLDKRNIDLTETLAALGFRILGSRAAVQE
jgi:erythronate-4-phosphate dehydrogenase